MHQEGENLQDEKQAVKKRPGGLKSKITLETVEHLRKRVLAVREEEGGKSLSYAKIAEALRPEFQQISKKTLEDYTRVVGKVPSKVFELYRSGTFSFTELTEFGQTDLEAGDIEYIASEYVSIGMNMPQLRKVKSLLRVHGSKMSVREAIDRATGKISMFAKPEIVKKIQKDFDSILEEASKYMTLSRVKVAQLMDLLPVSTMDKGKVHSDLFNKVYMLRHILSEQFEFVDKKVKTYLDELVRFVATETQLNELRKQEADRGSGDAGDRDQRGQEVQDPAVHGDRQVLQDPAGERDVQGRHQA